MGYAYAPSVAMRGMELLFAGCHRDFSPGSPFVNVAEYYTCPNQGRKVTPAINRY